MGEITITEGDVFELQLNEVGNFMLEVDGKNSESVFFTNGSTVPRETVETDIESGKLVRQS